MIFCSWLVFFFSFFLSLFFFGGGGGEVGGGGVGGLGWEFCQLGHVGRLFKVRIHHHNMHLAHSSVHKVLRV